MRTTRVLNVRAVIGSFWGKEDEWGCGGWEGFQRNTEDKKWQPTAQQLHPGTGLVNGGGVAEEKERHAGNAAEDQHHGQQHEHRGGLEGSRRDGAEVGEAAHAGEVPAGRLHAAQAVVKQAEVADVRRLDAVTDPVGLDENHHVDDGEADGEDGPENPDGPRVAHVVVMVDLGGFLGRQHVCCFFLSFFFTPLICLSSRLQEK